MKTVIAPNRLALGQFVALQAAQSLRTSLADKDRVNLVVATGSSQFEMLEELIKQPNIDWSRVHGFHLDEYLGISVAHPASFCGYLRDRFVSRVALGSFYFLDGSLPPDQLKRTADAKLAGQAIDVLLCGIGENGHLAFNDPPANFESTEPYLIVELDEACRRQQVGEGWFDSLDSVPTQAISMSIHQIMQAKVIYCTVPDRRKSEAVRNTIEGPVVPDVPASMLNRHPNCLLGLDAESASLLSSDTIKSCLKIN
jgi:glucosamine-6-phosphate deaminase